MVLLLGDQNYSETEKHLNKDKSINQSINTDHQISYDKHRNTFLTAWMLVLSVCKTTFYKLLTVFILPHI